MSKTKRNSLLLLSAAGIFTLLLAMSIPTITLLPGNAFSLGKSEVSLPGEGDSLPGSEVTFWMFRGFLTLVFALFPVYVIFSLFSARGRQRLVAELLILAALFLVAYYLDKHPLSENTQTAGMEITNATDSLNEAEDLPIAAFNEEDAPAWLAVGVILIASALGLGLLVASLWFVRQRSARSNASLHRLAETAQETINSLQAGGNFETAIIRCYHEMNRVVKEKRGIARETAMTAHEFEVYLISRGLPPHAVETLTRLFERVRYGSVPPETGDEAMALACLTEVVNTCRAV